MAEVEVVEAVENLLLIAALSHARISLVEEIVWLALRSVLGKTNKEQRRVSVLEAQLVTRQPWRKRLHRRIVVLVLNWSKPSSVPIAHVVGMRIKASASHCLEMPKPQFGDDSSESTFVPASLAS